MLSIVMMSAVVLKTPLCWVSCVESIMSVILLSDLNFNLKKFSPENFAQKSKNQANHSFLRKKDTYRAPVFPPVF
jgi:hypothetical protein